MILAAANDSPTGPVLTMAVVGAALIALLLLSLVMMIVSRRWRRVVPRVLAVVLGGLLAVYAVGRGVTEFWVVDFGDPASYRTAWGGPSLLGVFAVHSGPGLAVIILGLVRLRRRRRTVKAEKVSRQRVSAEQRVDNTAGRPDHECRTWDDSTGVAVPCPKSLDVPPCSAPPRSVSAYTRNRPDNRPARDRTSW
ncbi:hypothetical protein GCM10029964_077990 [Kibdelosporangium lantanae]